MVVVMSEFVSRGVVAFSTPRLSWSPAVFFLYYLVWFLLTFFLVLRWLKFRAEPGAKGRASGGKREKKKKKSEGDGENILPRWKVVSQSRFRYYIYRETTTRRPRKSSSDLKGLTNAFFLSCYFFGIPLRFFFLFRPVFFFLFSFCPSQMLQRLLEKKRLKKSSTTILPSPNKWVCMHTNTRGDHNNILRIPQKERTFLSYFEKTKLISIKTGNNSPRQNQQQQHRATCFAGQCRTRLEVPHFLCCHSQQSFSFSCFSWKTRDVFSFMACREKRGLIRPQTCVMCVCVTIHDGPYLECVNPVSTWATTSHS